VDDWDKSASLGVGATSRRSTSSLDTVRTREQYDQALTICRNAVAQWDPFSLLAAGAPTDEYDLEISSLVPKLRNARTPSDIAIAIAEVFGSTFGAAVVPDECAIVAAEIYARLDSAGLLSL
jgi:hypothetical protein